MTIEIHNPELESILQQQLKAGNFASVEDMDPVALSAVGWMRDSASGVLWVLRWPRSSLITQLAIFLPGTLGSAAMDCSNQSARDFSLASTLAS